MNIDLIVVGKTTSEAVSALVSEYQRRISRWVRFGVVMLPDVRRGTGNGAAEKLVKTEGEMLLRQFSAEDWVVLLDDKGPQPASMEFAGWLQKRLANTSRGRICFVIGGAYGFSQAVYERANELISLSRMTFSHQIVRAIFAEQLYRAFAILAGEPYHHE